MKKRFKETKWIDKIALSVFEKTKTALNIPIYIVSHLDVFAVESDEPYCLCVLGNENHENFDKKFEDKNCKAIIKTYPYIPHYHPTSEYLYQQIDGQWFYRIGEEDQRVLNIPLGPTTSFYVKELKKDILFGFFGQASGIRARMINALSKDSLLTFETYNGFGAFNDPERYCDFMSRCEIALIPMGQSPETYRLYEAALAGCALFGTPLPYTEYYKECPIMTIPWAWWNHKNYDAIFSFLKDNIQPNLKSMQNESKSWAEKWTNVDYLSNKIVKHINQFA